MVSVKSVMISAEFAGKDTAALGTAATRNAEFPFSGDFITAVVIP